MDKNIEVQPDNQIELTADIVAAYVSNNSLPVAGLSELIASVHGALTSLGTPTEPAVAAVEKPTAAQIRKSITDDGLISFEDGRAYKTMKRHLTGRGLTPETYRAKYGLPTDYPMTAPGYSAQRSALAKTAGLGQLRNAVGKAATKATETSEAAPETAKGRGRPRKTAEPVEAEA